MKNNPLVSVTICTYNAERYIEQTIRSVQEQTYQNFEIILVDDGSTDRTREMVSEFGKGDSRIKLHFEEHGGLAAARNKSFQYASGEWIAFIDCDDLCYPDRLEKQLKLGEKHPSAGVVFCNTDYIDEENRFLRRHLEGITFPELIKKNEMADILLQKGCVVDSQAFMARRDVLMQIPGLNPSFRYVVDYDFFIRLAMITDFAYTPERLAAWRIHPKQATKYMNSISDRELFLLLKSFAFHDKISLKSRSAIIYKLSKAIIKISRVMIKSRFIRKP